MSNYNLTIGPGNNIGAMAFGPGAKATGGVSVGERVVLVYHPRDNSMVARLGVHLAGLQRRGHALSVRATDDPSLAAAVAQATIVLPCLSPDMMADPFLVSETGADVMVRVRTREVRMIPIMLRTCDITGTYFAKLQVIPRGRPFAVGDEDQNGADIAQELRNALG